MNRAVFLDRDGVINIDKDYVYKIEEFEFKDGIFGVARHLQALGFVLVVVTNQSGIARGYYTLEDFHKVTEYMLKEFEAGGIKISKIYFCHHGVDANCECRKPKPGMILQAKKEFDIDLSNSWLIGDKESDIQAAKNAGVGKSILVLGKSGEEPKESGASYKISNLKEIEEIINN